MINISSNKQLDIILPNMNKALKEVLRSASPKQLELITKSKDLKSILNSLLKESSQNSANNKALLQLLKENPTLKNLANPSTTIKDLLNSLNQDTQSKATLPIEKVLKEFLVDIKQLSESALKNKITNSGVFLESKLKNAQNPQLELRDALKTLQTIVEKSSIFPVKFLNKNIQELLTNTILKGASNTALIQAQTDTTQELTKLANSVDKIIKTLQTNLKENVVNKSDSLFSKEMQSTLNKLSTLNTPQNLSSHQNIKEIIANDLKSLLLQTSQEITKSSHPNQTEILKNIDKLSLQIDYYQLMSHLSNSSSLYLPFSWDALQEGNIKLKKGEEDKFYCDIELKLKEYGELNLKLVLYEKNQLNIQIHSDNQELKNLIKENIPSLRSSLIELNITPREIRLLDASKKGPTSSYETIKDNINIGFEVKA
nr:flagellar hook-length control protein FliK [uncultured Sulfurimonas sp.]